VDFNTYGPTTGNDTREARALMDRLLVFAPRLEAARLRSEPEWRDGDRNSVTLAKEVDFRIVLSVLRDGATIHDDEGNGRASVQLLEGRAVVSVDDKEAHLDTGELATVNSDQRWQLRSDGDSTVLLTIAWPREKAGV
jgi:quercetin dioxygenase-like cupin family protein